MPNFCRTCRYEYVSALDFVRHILDGICDARLERMAQRKAPEHRGRDCMPMTMLALAMILGVTGGCASGPATGTRADYFSWCLMLYGTLAKPADSVTSDGGCGVKYKDLKLGPGGP